MTDELVLYCMMADDKDEVCGEVSESKLLFNLNQIGMRACVPMCEMHSTILNGLAHASGLTKTDNLEDLEH